MLESIQSWFDQLKNAVGKEKIPVIQAMWKEDAPRKALYILLNPLITFGIGEKSIAKGVSVAPTMQFPSIFDVCDAFEGRTGITDQDIANIQRYLGGIDSESSRRFAVEFLTKSLTLGVTAKTVNKAVGYEAIPQFSCMLAEKYFEYPHAIDGKQFVLTEKLDGIRCIAVVRMDKPPILYSRQGQVIQGLVDIERDLLHVRDQCKTSFVLDGELLVTDRASIPSKDQYKNTIKIVRKDGEKHGITYNAFDLLTLDEFESHQCVTPYAVRRKKLEASFGHEENISVLPVLYEGDDVEMIAYCLNDQRNQDHEGIMINLSEAMYEFKRTRSLLKVKVMQDCDLEIIGMQEGTGRFKGTLGALVVDYKGNAVGVGSGLTDEERKMMWSCQDKYIGRIATIQYFEETQDANGKKSIRFPVFKELREVGKEVSYS